ncbi:aminotransferase class V-fold PLP-dependent enzyme [Lactobacillus delbrueckii]|uniref:aminotransferase class V-fold PLP-dependent enzyme n=1 Tax=Lactobacillus delbrueckii TaxID=1584 RepID=UPI0020B85839|nr:aminotransferase class V-fold PLP-dependent enzyme [Lactobacillus delbrueckii]
MEISHRSALYKDLYAETKANLLELMKLDPAEYDVLFLSGGATQQFSTIPLNLARKYHRIAVVDSGHWAQRAAEDAAKVPGLTVDIVASAKDKYAYTMIDIDEIDQATQDKVVPNLEQIPAVTRVRILTHKK